MAHGHTGAWAPMMNDYIHRHIISWHINPCGSRAHGRHGGLGPSNAARQSAEGLDSPAGGG